MEILQNDSSIFVKYLSNKGWTFKFKHTTVISILN